jgi:twitching motility two-component system response regulator PilG
LRRQLHDSSALIDDPAARLWMAWLADSPQAMEQVLLRAQERHPDSPLAQAGLQWARGLNQLSINKPEPVREPAPAVSEPEIAADEPVEEPAIDTAESIVQGVQQFFGAPVTKSSASFKLPKTAQFKLPPPPVEELAPQPPAAEPAPAPTHSVEDDVFSLVAEEPEVPEAPLPPPAAPSSSGSWRAVPVQYPAELPAAASPTSGPPQARTNDRLSESAAKIVAKSKATQAPAKSDTLRPTDSQVRARSPDSALSKSGVRQAQPAGRAPTANVLVVDDSPTVRKLLTLMLTQHGYGVVSAVDGVDAVKSIAAGAPDLIITDINMPRLDGYKLCKLVTRNEKTRHIPVVMISAGVIDRLRGKLAGCTDYLTKPITPESLLAVVESTLVGSAVR